MYYRLIKSNRFKNFETVCHKLIDVSRHREIHNNFSHSHSFHLVDPSPWPLVAAFSALFLTFGGVLYMHGYCTGSFLRNFGFCMILFVMFFWWRDVIREAILEGQHTKRVQIGLKMGMILFIVSEIMFVWYRKVNKISSVNLFVQFFEFRYLLFIFLID